MDATTNHSLFRAWYDELKNFDTKRVPQGLSPHLGIGAGLVTVFVSSFFADHLAEALAIIVAYGPHAYFLEGLRIIDWRHGTLSNGAYLSFMGWLIEGPGTLALWVAAICGADFCSMLMQQVARRNSRWVSTAFRLVGGATLLVFAGHLYRQANWGLHPVPLSALIGGAVLIWKGFASIFAKSVEPEI